MAGIHQGLTGATSAQCGQEVHLAQLADARIGRSFQRCNTAAAHDLAFQFDHKIDASGRVVGSAHPVHFRIIDGESLAVGTELRHHIADDVSHT